MRRSIAALVIVLYGSGGCSFVFVSGPPANHRQLPMFDCSSSNAIPVLDTVFTALEALNLGLALAKDDQGWHDVFCSPGDTSCNPPLSRGAAIPFYIGLAALGGASMYFGYSRVSQCKDAKAELMVRASTAPPPGSWPPPAAPAPPPPAPAPGTPSPEPTPPGTVAPPAQSGSGPADHPLAPAVGHPPPLGPAPEPAPAQPKP